MLDERHLGDQLAKYADTTMLVLGLARGGVLVATEVAKQIRAPLDVLVVRKLGSPHSRELAIGAVTSEESGQQILSGGPDLLVENVACPVNIDEKAVSPHSHDEIARVLKCSPKAVEMRLYRARKILREALSRWRIK